MQRYHKIDARNTVYLCAWNFVSFGSDLSIHEEAVFSSLLDGNATLPGDFCSKKLPNPNSSLSCSIEKKLLLPHALPGCTDGTQNAC